MVGVVSWAALQVTTHDTLTSDTNQGGHLACYKSTADTNLINSENIHPILLAGTLPLVMSPCALVTTIQWLHPAPNIDIPPGQAAWALSCRHLLQMPKVRNLTTATPKYSDIHNWFSDTILLLYLTLTQSKYSLLLQYVCCDRSPSLNFLTTVSSWQVLFHFQSNAKILTVKIK